MAVSLHPSKTPASESVPEGHTYRLSPEQYARAVGAGIIPGDGRVELVDGFLRPGSAEGPADRSAGYRLSVNQYRAMAREGILTTEDRVELLEGWLVAKMTKHRPHVVSATRTFHAILGLLPAGWYPTKEDPIQAADSEPEPDVAVVRGSIDDYLERNPGPDDVAILIEVADSSLLRDRVMKKRLYGRARFAMYWIINLVNGRIEVYTEPSGPTEEPDYLRRQDYGPSDMIPLVIEGREVGRIAVRDLLP